MSFIEDVYKIMRDVVPKYGIKCYSATLAQFVLESANGTSELAINAHNYAGLKYRANRCPTSNGIYNKVGSEQDAATGQYISSNMNWFKFPDMKSGVIGYFDFINISNYANLNGITDPKEYLETIKADKYCTSINYVQNCMNVIQKYNLTKYDKKGENNMGYIMKTNLANRANYGNMRSTSKIKYIVIHYTANDGDSDEANGNYFHNRVVKASAHYFVDDDSITQSVPDNYVAYSVGDKRYSNYKTTGGAKFYGICTNTNSISIEMCDTKKDDIHNVTKTTIENTIALVKILMKKYNVTIDRVIRHFDISGKPCPSYYVNESEWAIFKNRISPSSATTSTSPSFYMYGAEPKSIITGNPNQFTQIVQNIKTVLNKDYGLKFTINGVADDLLLTNLGNIVMSTASYNKNLTYCLQQLFKWWNVNITIDGLYGSGTKASVMNFQKIWNIAQTGSTTKKFWYKILGK